MSASSTAATIRPRPLLGAATGALLALVINTIFFFAGGAILGTPIQASTDGTTASDVPYVAVIASSVLPLFVGAGVLWLLRRFTTSALRIWTIIAIVLTVLSLTGPLFLPVDSGSKIALILMHIGAGSAAIAGQHWAARRALRTA